MAHSSCDWLGIALAPTAPLTERVAVQAAVNDSSQSEVGLTTPIWTRLGRCSQQEKNYPCKQQGQCKNSSGLGSTTVGLIYLNPEGPVALNESSSKWEPQPVPKLSAADVRDSFSRMDHDDR